LFRDRIGFIVWINDVKAARNLEKYGHLHYISRRLHYAVLYAYAEQEEELAKTLMRLPYVRKVERSYRNEIRTEYNNNVPDQTRFYTF
jgi:uncharacterized protein YlbG (UPF0298 family)